MGVAPNQPNQWLSIAALTNVATNYVADSLQKSAAISRIDIRPEKGTVKFVFKNHFTEVQLDCATGDIRSVAQRNSDFIEKIHDGSIVDYFVNKDQSFFKLSYTSIMGIGLLLLSLSGFWLWINPKRIRRSKTTATNLPLEFNSCKEIAALQAHNNVGQRHLSESYQSTFDWWHSEYPQKNPSPIVFFIVPL